MKTNIFDLNFEELRKILVDWEEPEYRTQQIWEGLYVQLWSEPELFSSLPIPLRDKLAENFEFKSLEIVKRKINREQDNNAIDHGLKGWN